MEVKKPFVLPMYTCSELHGHNLFFTSYFYDCKTTFLNLYNKMLLGLRKQGMWAHDFCLLFQTSLIHNFLYQYAMAMKCLALSMHLIGFMMQVTECKYCVVCAHMPCFRRPGHKYIVLLLLLT